MELVVYENQEGIRKLPPIINPPNQLVRSESGARYTLSNNNIPHNIPSKNALRANGDYQAGIIDTWPAHSSNQRPSNLQLSLTKNNNLVISNAQAEGKPVLTPKPKFLDNLEKFLQRELQILGCESSTGTNEARLQAYREAFEYLLEEFKTYKPILSSIKNEYEMMLAAQREKIRELEPLKQMLVTLADQCDHKLMQYREEEKIEIRNLKEEKKKLMDLLLQLKNDRQTLQIQVEKLQNDLSSEHEKFRNEQDKRKLLILDLNDLRFQQEEAKMAELKREKKRQAEGGGQQNEDSSQDDPVTLKIALRVCRQNLTDAMKRLTKMEAEYNDVIPRRDYLTLEAVYKELEEKNENLENDLKNLKNEHNNLKEHTKKLEEKLQEVVQELETDRDNNTPRPDWEKCGTLVEGGVERWKDISINKSSIQLLDTLVNELGGGNKADFTGLGTGNDIVPYLRCEGKIKNKKLSKKDSIKVITDYLNYRMQKDIKKESSNYDSDELAENWISFLKKRYSSEAFEYSYSINDAFEKYSHDLIQFFQYALNGKVDEQVYFYEKKMLNQLVDTLKENDLKDPGVNLISKSTFKDVLKSFFKYKNTEQINLLLKTAEEESNSSEGSKIEFMSLFNEEHEDKQNSFLNLVKSYIKEERLGFANQIKESLANNNVITQAELKKAINSADDSIAEKQIDRILSWCFSSEKQLDFETFKKKIDNTNLFNYFKK